MTEVGGNHQVSQQSARKWAKSSLRNLMTREANDQARH